MVFWPWNERYLKEAMTHLLYPKDYGEKVWKEFGQFCQEFSPTIQELKHLLMLKLGATDWHKIRPYFLTGTPKGETQTGTTTSTKHIDWQWQHCVNTLRMIFQSEWTPSRSTNAHRRETSLSMTIMCGCMKLSTNKAGYMMRKEKFHRCGNLICKAASWVYWNLK